MQKKFKVLKNSIDFLTFCSLSLSFRLAALNDGGSVKIRKKLNLNFPPPYNPPILTLLRFQVDRHKLIDRQRAAWRFPKLQQSLSKRRLVNFNDSDNVVWFAAEVVHACG